VNTPQASPRPTTCPSLELLADLESGLLPPDASAQVLSHVETCRDCQTRLKIAVLRGDKNPANFPETIDWTTDSEVRVLPSLAPDRPEPGSVAPPVQTPPRTRLGQYRLVQILGQGGMGAVCLAFHLSLKKWVAVKILPTEATMRPSSVARFRREMEAIGHLDHPNVVRATDAGEYDGVHFLVMELVDGADLNRLLRETGRLSVADACEAIRQAAAGLQYAHERGMVHRDVKPSNLILNRLGQVKVLDMGLALIEASRLPGGAITGTGQIMGTLNFMAPEQWEASNKVDIRADVYSLGCTLYTLLTGHVPYGGDEFQSAMQKMAAHASAPIPPARWRRPEVTAELDAVVTKMMAKAPADRYATPHAAAAALAPFAAAADLRALAETVPAAEMPAPPTDDPSATGSVNPLATTIVHARPVKSRWPWVVGVVVLLTAGGVSITLAALRPKSNSPNVEQPANRQPFKEGEWNNLIDRAPEKVRWINSTKESSVKFNDKTQALSLDTYEPTLVPLGHTGTPNYKLRIGFRQANWTGNVGLYFGARLQPMSDGLKYHFVMLREGLGPQQAYGIDRVEGLFQPIVGHLPTPFTIGRGTCYVGNPAPRNHTLLISVKPWGLEDVSWDGISCERLYSGEANKGLANVDYIGEFGIVAFNASANVVFADFMPFGENK